MSMYTPDDSPFDRIDPNSGSLIYGHSVKVSKSQTRDKKAQRDDWKLDSHDPQGHQAASQDKDKIDPQSRQVFSISMAGYQDGRKELPNVLNDAELVEKAFGRLGYTVTNCAKDVDEDALKQMFQKFLDSLNTRTYAVILHIAGHGEEHNDGRLTLNLVNGSKVFVDDLFRGLNQRLDKLVLSPQSKDDFVHDVGILVIWDACRERPESQLSIPHRAKRQKLLRVRQQAFIHSCMSGGQSLDSIAGSNHSPFMVALGGLLDANTPFTVFEFAESLNARVKAFTKGVQSVELNAEATNLNHRYDWFVDLETCNQLRIFDVRSKRLQAESNDGEACARLITLWKVPCKSTESSEDCLQSLQDSQQRLLSDLQMDPAVNAGLRAKDAEQAKDAALAKAKDAESRAADAEQQTKDAVQAQDAALAKAKDAESRAADAEQQTKDAVQAKDVALAKAKDAESRAAEAEQQTKDAVQAKDAALAKAKDAESRAAEAEQQTKDAVQAKDAALAKAKDAESRAADAEQQTKDAVQAKDAALAKAKDAESRAADAEQQTKDAVQAKDAALAKAKDAERLLAEAQRRATDAERSVAQKEEKNNMLERGNKDAEKRAAEAQEAARIAKGQIIAVCRQVASCLNEDAPGQNALRQFCRETARKFPDVDAAFSETLVHEAVEQSTLRDARKIQPPCGGTWTSYFGDHPTLCEGSKYFGCHIHVGSSSQGFRCSMSGHTLCYVCFEKNIAGLCPNCRITGQRASEATQRAVQAEGRLRAVQAEASQAKQRADQAWQRANQAEGRLRACEARQADCTMC